jgi:hypothetical protein
MGFYTNDATAANNTSINSIAMAGSSTPANIDNGIRELAAQGKQFSLDLGGNSAGGSADVLTLSLNDTVLAAYHDKLIFAFVAGNDNATTTPTLNVNSIGAKTIKKAVAGVETAVAAGDLQSGGLYMARYRSSWASAAGAWQLIDLNVASENQNIAGGLTLTSTDAGASAGPILELYRNSATPAASDSLGIVNFSGEDSGGNTTIYASIGAQITDPTNASEDGGFGVQVMKAGTLTSVVSVTAAGIGYANNASANAYQYLGAITTTSGATQSLAGLVLTNFKFLRLVVSGVSHNNASAYVTLDSSQASDAIAAASLFYGFIDVDLTTGIGVAQLGAVGGAAINPYLVSTAYTTATTTVTAGVSAGAFDAGSIAVYGI